MRRSLHRCESGGSILTVGMFWPWPHFCPTPASTSLSGRALALAHWHQWQHQPPTLMTTLSIRVQRRNGLPTTRNWFSDIRVISSMSHSPRCSICFLSLIHWVTHHISFYYSLPHHHDASFNSLVWLHEAAAHFYKSRCAAPLYA